jgi:cyclopropane fatty-acyl-phospholipid synthase-like methyltransferase
VHLGYWDDPPSLGTACRPGEFDSAQACLTARVIELAHLQPGQRVLDVGCGLGGTLAVIAPRHPGMTLVGLNIDRRQLELCRSIALPAGGSLALVEADAVVLPFAAASFDRVFCVEAMHHFRSRRMFLAEAARLLRRGGAFLITDILLRDPATAAPWSREVISATLRRDYGPWPDPWVETASLRQWADAAALDLVASEDWTAHTLPSYRIVAPDEAPELRRPPHAGNVLRWLHTHGWLTYQMLVFRRR